MTPQFCSPSWLFVSVLLFGELHHLAGEDICYSEGACFPDLRHDSPANENVTHLSRDLLQPIQAGVCSADRTSSNQGLCYDYALTTTNLTGVYLVQPRRTGRLGNTLFEFAAAYAISRLSGRALLLSSEFYELFELFPRLLQFTFLEEDDSSYCLKIGEEINKWGVFDPRLKYFIPNTDVHLAGYFQSWKYFWEFHDELEDLLLIDPSYKIAANKIYSSIRKNIFYEHAAKSKKAHPDMPMGLVEQLSKHVVHKTALVGIHVRRKDKIDKFNYDIGHTSAPRDYFLRAMDYFRAKYENVRFLATGDDVSWVMANLNFPDVEFSVGHDHLQDFTLLAGCDHVIMSTGTFGYWAGWLAGGEVVVYAYQARPESTLWEGFSVQDHLPPSWKLMV